MSDITQLNEKKLHRVAVPPTTIEGRGMWCPDRCPITQRQFWGWIEHPRMGYVPTYGGPYDTYTIPVPYEAKSGTPWHELELTCERYDHDAGAWVDSETVSLRLIDESLLNKLLDVAEAHNAGLMPYDKWVKGLLALVSVHLGSESNAFARLGNVDLVALYNSKATPEDIFNRLFPKPPPTQAAPELPDFPGNYRLDGSANDDGNESGGAFRGAMVAAVGIVLCVVIGLVGYHVCQYWGINLK